MTGMCREIQRKEYVFPAVMAAAFIVAGSLPYIYAYAITPDQLKFTGFVGRGVFGPNGYMMFAYQAQHGQNLFENLMTPETVPRTFFNLEWWLFGKMALWTGLSLIAVFHVWRAATAVLLMFSLYYLLTLCLRTRFQRRMALSLITLGSGLGWVPFLASRVITFIHPASLQGANEVFNIGLWMHGFIFPLPPDVRGSSLPAYTINQPHFALATALLVLAYAFLLAGEHSGKIRYFVYSGLAVVLHAFVRPYNLPENVLIFMLFPLLLCVRDGKLSAPRFARYALPALMLLPILAYYAWLTYARILGSGTGPVWVPGLFVDHILWLGLPFILTVCAWRGVAAIRTAPPWAILLSLWLVLAFLIEQANTYYKSGQEAAFAALMVVPAILAIAPLRSCYHWFRRQSWFRKITLLDPYSPAFKRCAAVALIVISMPSFAIAYVNMFTSLNEYPAPYYITKDTYAGLEWLAANAQTHDTVLAAFTTSQIIPRIAGVKVFHGHYMITPNSFDKKVLAERFFHTHGDDAFKQQLIKDYGIRYVVLGPQEDKPDGMVPAEHMWLKQCFSAGRMAIYKVE